MHSSLPKTARPCAASPRGGEIGRGRCREQLLEREAAGRGGEAQQDESADERGDHLIRKN